MTDAQSTPAELTPDDALAQLRSMFLPVVESETVPLADARGRVLATDVVSTIDLPPFDSAAMDGYALAAGLPAYTVVGEARAGHRFPYAVQAQQAVRIMTGAEMPDGADTVLMRERADVDGDQLRATAEIVRGVHVRKRGEHIARGSTVLARGRQLSAVDLGLVASVGLAQLLVWRRLRVALLSTGDELADPPVALKPGTIFDGNRPLLKALLERAGHVVVDLGIVRDEAKSLSAAIAAAANGQCDAIISTGGAALGDADVVRRQPGVQFIAMNIRPGRGVVAGHVGPHTGPIPLIGLPGNAVAAYLMYQLIGAPLLAHLAGCLDAPVARLRLPLAVDVQGKQRTDWRRARLVVREGTSAVEPLAEQGSAMLRTLSEADALVEIPAAALMAAGKTVQVIPLAAID